MPLDGAQILSVQACLVTASYLFVAVRLWVRRHNKQPSLILSDILLCGGVLFITGMEVGNVFIYHYGAMKDPGKLSTEIIRNPIVVKAWYSSIFLYDMGMFFPKLSIVAFYYHLIHPTSKRMRLALNALACIVAACACSTFFVDLLGCGFEVSVNWSGNPHTCTRVRNFKALKINYSMNIGTDVLIFLLPFPILLKLRLRSIQEKVGLIGTFALGLISMTIGSLRIYSILVARDFVTIYIWSTAEICTATMVVSLPALRPLLRRFQRRVSNAGDSSGSRRRNNEQRRSMPPKAPNGGGAFLGADNSGAATTLAGDVEPAWENMELKYIGGCLDIKEEKAGIGLPGSPVNSLEG